MIDPYIVGAAAMLLIEFLALVLYGLLHGGRK